MKAASLQARGSLKFVLRASGARMIEVRASGARIIEVGAAERPKPYALNPQIVVPPLKSEIVLQEESSPKPPKP